MERRARSLAALRATVLCRQFPQSAHMCCKGANHAEATKNRDAAKVSTSLEPRTVAVIEAIAADERRPTSQVFRNIVSDWWGPARVAGGTDEVAQHERFRSRDLRNRLGALNRSSSTALDAPAQPPPVLLGTYSLAYAPDQARDFQASPSPAERPSRASEADTARSQRTTPCDARDKLRATRGAGCQRRGGESDPCASDSPRPPNFAKRNARGGVHGVAHPDRQHDDTGAV